MRLPHQSTHARLSTGAKGFGLSSAEAQRMPATVGSMVATAPEDLTDILGIIGEKVRRGLPDSDLVRRIWSSVRDLRDVHGVSEEAMSNIVKERWRDRAFRRGEQDTSGQSMAEVLPAHDAETTSSSKAQYRLGKPVNRVRYHRFAAYLEQLPETPPPRGTGDPNGEKEMRGFAKARQRSQSGPGATAFLRADPSTRPGSCQRRSLCPRDGGFWGWRSSWRRGALAAVRRTQTPGMRDYVIDRERRSASTGPWFTRSPAPLSGCRSATRWKAELPPTPTGTFE